MKLPDIAIVRFIKQYPRVSILIGVLALIIFLSLPGSLDKKVKFILSSALLGFLVAIGVKYYLARRKI